MLQKDVARVLSPGEFFEALPAVLAPRLPAALRAFDMHRGRGRLLKLYYGHPETHFEVWHHQRSGRLEIGLHLEGPCELNRDVLEHFRSGIIQVRAGLRRAELEPWDRGWARLYETVPAPELTDRLLASAAALLAAYIVTLQPMLETFWEKR